MQKLPPTRAPELLESLAIDPDGKKTQMVCCPAHKDSKPSLAVTIEKDRILMNCKAGCDNDSILAVTCFERRDMFFQPIDEEGLGIAYTQHTQRPKPKPSRQFKKPEKSASDGELIPKQSEELGSLFWHEYKDENGNRTYGKERDYTRNGKDTKIFHWNEEQQDWLAGKNNLPTIPYRLPELIQLNAGDKVFVVEGELKADILADLGFNVTTFGNFNAFKPELAKYLDGLNVVLLADNDDSGEQFIDKIGDAIWKLAKSIRVVRFPEFVKGGDIADWIKYHEATHDDVVQLVDDRGADLELEESTAKVIPFVDPNLNEPDFASDGSDTQGSAHSMFLFSEQDRNDNRLSKEFVNRYGHLIRWVREWGSWLVWDGKRWRLDDKKNVLVLDLVMKFAESLWHNFTEFSKVTGDRNALVKLRNFVSQCNDVKRRNAIEQGARSDNRVSISLEELNTHADLLNVKNGTLDLATGELLAHDQEHLITQLADVVFDPAAECPMWLDTINLMFREDQELIEYVQKIIGFSFSGNVTEHVLPMIIGPGGNGKSTIWNPLVTLLGDYGHLASESLIMGNGKGHPTEKAALYQKRFVAISEPEQNAPLKESRVKEFTGDVWINCRRMREDEWKFRRTHTLWLSSNHPPKITGTDEGIWRRVKYIPATVIIKEVRSEIKDAVQLLLAESSGILNWCIEGFQKYLAEGIDQLPAAVKEHTAKYRHESNPLSQWIDECCVVGDDCHATAKDLLDSWNDWNGREMTQTRFGKMLSGQFEAKRKIVGGVKSVHYLGIGLKLDDESGFPVKFHQTP